MADCDAVLLRGVVVIFSALADGVEVDGDAEGGADFVLAAVAAADGCGLVIEDAHKGLEEVFDFFGLFYELGLIFQEGENGGLDGGDGGLEAHDGADVWLAAFLGEVFFVKGFADEGEDGAVATGRGLDDVWDELFFCLLVEVFEGLSGVFLVLAEVVVATVGDAFKFLLAEGEVILDVVSFLRVVSALTIGDVEDVKFFFIESDLVIEGEAVGEPFIGEAEAVFRSAEILDFHLLEFTRAEGEVPWVNLVTERFADLCDSEGEFDAIGVHHVLGLNEDRLGGFWA